MGSGALGGPVQSADGALVSLGYSHVGGVSRFDFLRLLFGRNSYKMAVKRLYGTQD